MIHYMVAVAAGLLSGIVSGFGIGGGTILMVYLTIIAGIDQRIAQGINLLYFIPTAAAALILHAKNRYVQWKVVIPAAIAGCVTAAILSFIALNIELSLLKKMFGLFLILTGISELFKKSS